VKTLSGWKDDITLIPDLSNSDLYNYLVLNSQRTHDGKPTGAKRQLKAKVFYNDRHVHSVEYHEINKTISHCYIRASVIPSIPTQKENKKDYSVWVCIAKVSGNVQTAGCGCEAGSVLLMWYFGKPICLYSSSLYSVNCKFIVCRISDCLMS